MNVTVCNFDVPALIDTGASISVVSHLFYKMLLARNKFESESCHVRVFLANGATQVARLRIKLPVVIKTNTLMHVFYVVPKLARSIILGVDFLRSTRANIKFDNLATDVLTIRAKETISIPPNRETHVCAIVLADKSLHDTIGVTENMHRNKTVPYCVKRGVVRPTRSKNEVPMVIYNSSGRSYQIKKGAILGLYSLRVEEDFMGPDDLKEEPIKSFDCDYIIDKDNLTGDQKRELRELLEKNSDTFISSDDGLTLTTEYTHRIDLKSDYKPINVMAYRTSPGRTEIMESLLEGQEKAGVIERCTGRTEWCSPAFLVEKGKAVNGKRAFRIVVDMRHLNKQIKNQAYNFPRIDDTLNKVGTLGAKYFSTLDAYSGFFQIPLRERDRNLTAFATPGKTWRYRTMPMGLSTSPKAFHNVIENVVRHLPSCLPYVDDIIVASPTWDDHLTDLNNLFQAFRNANIKFKKPKCNFGFKSLPFLGFVVSEQGIHPNPDKVKLIRDFPIPKNGKQVKSFNGLATYYQSFIQNFSLKMQPLYALTKRNIIFEWKEVHQIAFDKIKNAIADDVVLKYPNFSKPFTIATDSSKFAVGACISQLDSDRNLRPVAFAGRKLSTAERNYSVTDQELVGIKFALIKFEHYVIGRKFTILTDHAALVALGGKVKLTGRMAKWADFFARFDFDIKHLKGKLNVVPDALSRIPYDDIVEMDDLKPYKQPRFNSVHAIKFYSQDDYLENYPIVMYKSKPILKNNKICGITSKSEIIFDKSSLVAESRKNSKSKIDYKMLNELYFNDKNAVTEYLNSLQMTKIYQDLNENKIVNDSSVTEKLQIAENDQNLYAITRAQTKAENDQIVADDFPSYDDTDTFDDPIVTQADSTTLDSEEDNTSSQRLAVPNRPMVTVSKAKKRRLQLATALPRSYETAMYKSVLKHYQTPMSINRLVSDQEDDKYCAGFRNYLENNSLPASNHLARRILLSHDKFFMYKNILYRYNDKLNNSELNQPQLVVPQKWVPKLLLNMHDTPSGAHMGITKLTSVVKPRFYWPSMGVDIHNHVNTCHKCLEAKYVKNPLKLPMTLHEKSPAPFAHVMIDTLGPIHPTKNKYQYIQIVVDVYSRFIVAWPSRRITAEQTTREFFSNFICRYGLPEVIYSDRGPAFRGTFAYCCKVFGIENRYGSPYQSRTQGLVERANQSVLQSLRTFTDKNQTNWCEFVSAIAFGLNVSSSYALGYSPYMLIYGRSPRLPGITALSDINNALSPVQEHLMKIIRTQDELVEKVENTFNLTQTKMKARWDKGKKFHDYKVGQFVYVKNKFRQVKGTSEKLQPLYAGPYLIIELPSAFTVKLRKLSNGKTINQTVHVERLKRVNFKEVGTGIRM